MFSFVKPRLKLAANLLCPSLVAKHEFRHQSFVRFNERPVEFGFVFRKIREIYPTHILDVGTGQTALPHMMRNCGAVVTAIDNIRDYWPSGMTNRHYHVLDDDICCPSLNKRYDFITCVSVLEHIENSSAAIKGMFSLLNSNGHLVLTFPYRESEYIRNVYELPGSSYGQGAPYITQSYSRENINLWLTENQGEIVEQEYWQCWDGEFWTVGNQIIPPQQVASADRHQLTCLHIRKSA